jgi:hypothetical protein
MTDTPAAEMSLARAAVRRVAGDFIDLLPQTSGEDLRRTQIRGLPDRAGPAVPGRAASPGSSELERSCPAETDRGLARILEIRTRDVLPAPNASRG